MEKGKIAMTYNSDTLTVTCTDNGNKADGIVLDWRGDTVRVNLNGIVLLFKKVKGNLYAANMAGMEFTIEM